MWFKKNIQLSYFWRLDITDMVLIHNTTKVQYNLCHGKLLKTRAGGTKQKEDHPIFTTQGTILWQ